MFRRSTNDDYRFHFGTISGIPTLREPDEIPANITLFLSAVKDVHVDLKPPRVVGVVASIWQKISDSSADGAPNPL